MCVCVCQFIQLNHYNLAPLNLGFVSETVSVLWYFGNVCLFVLFLHLVLNLVKFLLSWKSAGLTRLQKPEKDIYSLK